MRHGSSLLISILLIFISQWGCAMTRPAGPEPIPVIYDTDIGYDIDDTWALAFLLASPELDLKLVVTDYQNTPEKAKIVAKFLEAAGRTDVPIGIGKYCNNIIGPQRKWIVNYDLSQYPGKVYEDGIQAMVDTIMDSPKPVTLLTVGPVPNIPEALAREPRIAQKARLVSMGGSIAKRSTEWNFRAHRISTKKMIAADWDITLAPLDTANKVVLDGDLYAMVRDAENPMAKALMENFRLWYTSTWKGRPDSQSSILYDTVAVYLAFAQDYCLLEDVKISISDKGEVVPDPNGKLVHAATQWKDLDAFEKLLAERIANYQVPTSAK